MNFSEAKWYIAIVLLVLALWAYDEYNRPARIAKQVTADRAAEAVYQNYCLKKIGRLCPAVSQEQLDRNTEEAAEGITKMLRGEEP